jgi:hypothetical protein
VNQGSSTRKEQVLRFLQENAGRWVDGPVLANESIGGSEGLRRVRELIAEGQPISRRRHPSAQRDIWQYRYSPKVAPATIAPTPMLTPQPVAATRSLRDAVQQGPDGRYAYVATSKAEIAPPSRGDMFPADVPLPSTIAFGSVAICPRCKGYRRKAGKDSHGRPRPADEYCRDPDRRAKGERCRRCNGHGVVPNVGPIPMTMPEGLP